MRRVTALILATTLCTAPAFAQKSKTPYQPPTTCEAAATAMGALSLGETSTVEAIPNGCRVTNLVVDLGNGYSRFELAEVRLVAPDLFTRWAEERLPDAAEFTIKGIQFAPRTGNPTTDYILGVQQSPYDVHIQYRWDAATAELVLVDASVSGAMMGSIALSGTLTGVSNMPTAIGGPEDVDLYGVSRLSISLTNRSFIETFAVSALIDLLPGGDPRTEISALQATLRATVSALPDTTADADSRQALVDFITAFPHPRETYELGITADPPVPVPDLLDVTSIPAAAVLLSRLKLAARHLWPAP